MGRSPPLEEQVDERVVHDYAAGLSAGPQASRFDGPAFARDALQGLSELALKVFKLGTFTLPPNAHRDIVRRQHLAPISTRRDHPGAHAVDIQGNGQPSDSVPFELRTA